MPAGVEPSIVFQQPQSPEDWRQARDLVEQYAASLRLDLGFQNIAHELDHLSSEYSAPTGAFLVATERGKALDRLKWVLDRTAAVGWVRR